MRRKKPAKVRKPMPPPSKRHIDKRRRLELDRIFRETLQQFPMNDDRMSDDWRPER